MRTRFMSCMGTKHRSSTDRGEVIILFWLRPVKITDVKESYKKPEFLEKSLLSGAGKHHNFQVTSCHHFDTTNVDFAYIESE